MEKEKREEDKKEVKQVIDAILKLPKAGVSIEAEEESKIRPFSELDPTELQEILKATVVEEKETPSKTKVIAPTSIEDPTDDESSDSDSETESESEESTDDEAIAIPEGKKKQDEMLLDSFAKLYSHFDEDDVEMCNDILGLLDILKKRDALQRLNIYTSNPVSNKRYI